MADWKSDWIWTPVPVAPRNSFVRFRKVMDYSGGASELRITADSRYTLWINGRRLGFGPVRSWLSHWHYDTYDIAPHLKPGEPNVIAVLVNHFGEGNFQYNPGPPGLAVELRTQGGSQSSPEGWLTSPDPAFVSAVPRISVQEGFEEQYDARSDSDWMGTSFDPSTDSVPWFTPVLSPEAKEAHGDMQDRGIPFMTTEQVLPTRVVEAVRVRRLPLVSTVYYKPYLTPEDITSNMLCCNALLLTRLWSPEEAGIRLWSPHKGASGMKVGGLDYTGGDLRIAKGWTDILINVSGLQHLQEFTVVVEGPEGMSFDVSGSGITPPSNPHQPRWALAGPFELSPSGVSAAENCFDESVISAVPLTPQADLAAAGKAWESTVESLLLTPYCRIIKNGDTPMADAFAESYSEKVQDGGVTIEGLDNLLSDSGWAVVHPPGDGSDARILLDWGREVVGFHAFEVMAQAGTIIDLHNFEFIQPDDRRNMAEGMNNSLRYTCKEGYQSFQSLQRRGYGLTYVSIRNMSGPVKLKGIKTIFSTYPQAHKGSFISSDWLLNRIWEVGAHTLRCCAEDTYTDCPTYEQTHWVGDARNEALIDWTVNGDGRLWFRCLQQTGQSLERSRITESNVPSAWVNILPAWSFLWMRSCREYCLYTGDMEGSRELLGYVERNIGGIRGYINPQGLFEIRGWNMFDWADMDTPNRGVVTHLNCQAAQALKESADLAGSLGRGDLAEAWMILSEDLATAVNGHLWNEGKGAFTDCIRDGAHSPVYSQQTQTAAVMSGVARGSRADRCRALMHHPPEDFVKAGSPFFEFFLLEAYQQEGRAQDLITTIREDWGFMVDMGASTFWEMWSGRYGRLTRSHCHGWSAAPTYFLGSYSLGVRPLAPGFSEAIVEPHPGDLEWMRGSMPTPHGAIRVDYKRGAGGGKGMLKVMAPRIIGLSVIPPEGAEVVVSEY